VETVFAGIDMIAKVEGESSEKTATIAEEELLSQIRPP
jgi:hypothetical protein